MFDVLGMQEKVHIDGRGMGEKAAVGGGEIPRVGPCTVSVKALLWVVAATRRVQGSARQAKTKIGFVDTNPR